LPRAERVLLFTTMPKLYYTSTSCGAANFIAAKLAGVTIESEQVVLQTHLTTSGVDFYTINPKGNVPTIVLDDGTILNENAATLIWIGDQDASHSILPAAGTVDRYLVHQAISFVGTEYHKVVGNLFNPTISQEVRDYFVQGSNTKLTYLNDVYLKDKEYVVGGKLSVGDLYLYICLSWSGYLNLDLTQYPVVNEYFKRIGALPGVVAAHEAMASNPTHT
jgi:glutathione S-transferase